MTTGDTSKADVADAQAKGSPRPVPDRTVRTPFFYGWVILAVAAIANFGSAPGQTYTFSVFLGFFVDDLGLSSTLVSTLYLAGSLTAAVLIIAVGRALDWLGSRLMLVIIGALMGLGAIWMSRVSDAFSLYVGFAVLRTLGQGSLSLIPSTLVSIWFVRRRGRALALMALGGAAALGVFPALANSLVSAYDWRGAWMGIAFIAWALIIPAAAIFARRSPESVGLLPDGDDPGRAPAARSSRRTETRSFTLRQAMRTRALWLLMLASSAQSLVGTGLGFHQVSLLSDRGMSTATATGVFGVSAPMMIVGQFVSGFLADRFPIRYLIAFAQLLITGAVLLVFIISEPWHAYVYGVALGFGSGFVMNSLLAVWPQYFGREHLGSIRGVSHFATMAAAASGPLPLAAAFDLIGNYTYGLLAYAVLPPLCGIAALMATRPALPQLRR